MNALSSHAARVLTAVVGLCVLAGAMAAGGWAWFVLVLVACLVGLWEFYALFPAVGPTWRCYGLACGAAMLGATWRFGPLAGFGALLACFWLGLTLHLAFGRRQGPQADRPAKDVPTAPDTAHLLVPAGLLYVPGCLLFALSVPMAGVITVLAVVMATDTGAYYAGHMLGGPKIWPRVSPKKTWAGSLGGLAAALAASLICALWLGGPGLGAWLVLGVCLSLVSQMGDFIESGLKRACGVKDSGAILPGHGGLLDRIDGLLPALLAYALARALAVFP